MAAHSSVLAWRIPWTEEPGGPQSMGLQRVGHQAHTRGSLSELCQLNRVGTWYVSYFGPRINSVFVVVVVVVFTFPSLLMCLIKHVILNISH